MLGTSPDFLPGSFFPTVFLLEITGNTNNIRNTRQTKEEDIT